MQLARLAAAAILAAGFSAAAYAKPVTLAGETNLRAAPGTQSEVVTLMPKGETVEVGNCDAGWCEVTWNEKKGFAISRNLGIGSPAPRRVARRAAPPPGYEDDEYEVAAPPRVYYAPGPYVSGPYYGYYPYGYGYGYGYGWRRGYRRW